MCFKQVIVLLIAFFSVIQIQAQPTWTVNGGSYEYDMTVTGVVLLNDTLVENTKGVIIGAFDENDNCVGRAEALFYTSVNKYRVPLMVFSNTNGVQVSLKAYIPGQEYVYDLLTTIQFESNSSLGNFGVPFELEALVISTEINKSEMHSNVVSVFPNPANEVINVHLNSENDPYQMFIYSLTGELIEQRNSSGTEEIIHIKQLPCGTYLLKIKGNRGVFTEKFVKK